MKRRRQESLWSFRDFRLFWASDTASQFGFFINNTVTPLLAVTVLAATPVEMGFLTAAETVAFLIVGLPAGVWVDRMRRRRLMVTADFIRATLVLSIPLAWLLELLTFVHLMVVTVAVGAATVFFDVAYQSYLPSLVRGEYLAEANGKLQASQSLGQSLGPGIGGLAAKALGAGSAIFLTGVGYLFSAFSLLSIKTVEQRPSAQASRGSLRSEIFQGLRYVFRNPYLRPIVLCSMTSSFFNSVVIALEILFLSKDVRLSEWQVGVVLGLAGVGAVLGAVTANWWARKAGEVRAIWLVPLLTWPAHVLFPFAQPGWFSVVAVVGMSVFAYGTVIYNVVSVTFRQQICPDGLLGRMTASMRFLVWGVMPVGAVFGGVLAQGIGVRWALVVGTVGILSGVAWLIFSPLKKAIDFKAVMASDQKMSSLIT
jgi:predicted MFS family arabinose efflux permease